MRRRQLDDTRRRLAAVDLDDDNGWRQCPVETGTCLEEDRLNGNILREELTGHDDDDEVDPHRRQRRRRLRQAVRGSAAEADPGVRRGGSVESDSCGSRSASTDGSASALTDTDHEHAVSLIIYSSIPRLCSLYVVCFDLLRRSDDRQVGRELTLQLQRSLFYADSVRCP